VCETLNDCIIAKVISVMSNPVLQTAELIFRKIHLVRDHNVLLDTDLAELYGVETKAQNRLLKETKTDFRMILCLNCQ